MVEPVNVVRQLQSQLLNRVKPLACNEFCLDHSEGRFRNRVIIGTAFHTQGTANLKALQEFIDQRVVKLAAPVCVKYQDFKQVPLHGSIGIMNQLGGFVCPCAVPDDFSSTQIQ